MVTFSVDSDIHGIHLYGTSHDDPTLLVRCTEEEFDTILEEMAEHDHYGLWDWRAWAMENHDPRLEGINRIEFYEEV